MSDAAYFGRADDKCACGYVPCQASVDGCDPALREKLAFFDRNARQAVEDVLNLLMDERWKLIELARERHVWGHHEYGDANLREWDDATLRRNLLEELADALVYRADELRRASI